MSPKSKKKQQLSLKAYQNMTLEELSNLEHSEDEEINEEDAFNSDDEREFGEYFSSSARNMIRSKNLALPIPLQHNTVRIVEIAKGSKMELSSICLDVSDCDFERVKLMYRCVYPNQCMDQVDAFCCLCNYLNAKKGGMGLMPSSPMNLEVAGPCKVEFRAEIAPTTFVGGGINLFGVIRPVDHFIGDDVPSRYAEVFSSDEEELESKNESVGGKDPVRSGKNDDDNGKSNGAASKTTKKRKLEEDDTAENSSLQPTTEPATPANSENISAKLTKSQRKRLAKEKAKQLEETLSAARRDANNENTNSTETPAKKKSKKKKKKQSSEETNTPKPKPLSTTRERRLADGLVVSDMLLGTGAPVKPGKRVSLHYTGSLRSTGKVFDKNNSKQHPLVFRQGTGEVIRGLERGLDGMKVGGERVITIPSKLGYGTKGQGADIPPDADLVFDVKVLKVG